MFIERTRLYKSPPRSSGAKRKPDLHTIAGNIALRPGGVGVGLTTGFHKHSASLEEPTWLRRRSLGELCGCGGFTNKTIYHSRAATEATEHAQRKTSNYSSDKLINAITALILRSRRSLLYCERITAICR
jgi:hypothetical protein